MSASSSATSPWPKESVPAPAPRSSWTARCTGGRGRFFYARTAGPAPFLEVIEPGSKLLAAFGHMREAARTWDGRDPVRRVSSRDGDG